MRGKGEGGGTGGRIRSVYTVGQVNSYIRNMFAQDFLLQELSVKGEVQYKDFFCHFPGLTFVLIVEKQ